MEGIARLNRGIYTAQYNVKLSPDLKERIRKLKHDKAIDTGEEIRKAIAQLVDKLEKATA